MTNDSFSEKTSLSLDYHFNESEIKILARLLRNNQEQIPDALLDFSMKIERAIYNSMSIDEAEAFYS
ncbi:MULTISPECIES: hypothetical protein [unclassified Treponema]|uniref:hypothetical protein n=1 Tax=unclassified Treponema TaxID=2638727 RepID=UPI001B06C1E7|nr:MULTISPECIES: hypothetical protein [unclassified Treponema]MBO6218863.1 hypothetical protein [Treponema sp.]MBQ8680614.1 hypothetical protein [Treponema sp.]